MKGSTGCGARSFPGAMLIVAPHMDDETLGCGQLLASRATGGAPTRVLFATDGARSPEAPAGTAPPAVDLPSVRQAEALEALSLLGVRAGDVEFLGLPDGRLARSLRALEEAVVERTRAAGAEHVLVPFRYDRHPDHMSVHRAVTRARRSGAIAAQVVEYFVYTQWRLLPAGDVRAYLPEDDVVRVDSAEAVARKRAALACYRSQTTCYFPGQRRPILTPALIERVCNEPETFLLHRPGRDGRRGLARARGWIPLACRLEPALKSVKDAITERLAR